MAKGGIWNCEWHAYPFSGILWHDFCNNFAIIWLFFYFLLKCFQFMLQILLFCTSAIISNIAIASSELCDLVQNHPFSGSWYPFMSLWLGKSQIESLEARLNDQSGRWWGVEEEEKEANEEPEEREREVWEEREEKGGEQRKGGCLKWNDLFQSKSEGAGKKKSFCKIQTWRSGEGSEDREAGRAFGCLHVQRF